MTEERQRLDEVLAARAKTVDLPAPTAAPLVVAFGASLITAGLVTHVSISVTGALLLVAGCVSWFREVLPHERHETVAVETTFEFPTTIAQNVARLDLGEIRHRARLPIEIHPVSSGIKGGLAGSVAMAAARQPLRAHARAASGIPSTSSPPAPPRAWRACPPRP